MRIKELVAVLVLATASLSLSAQSVINLNLESDGKYTMEASINGVGVKTYYSPESWFASLSSTTYLFLYENGYISDNDVLGLTTVKMPDGSTTKAASFTIRNLRIGNIIVKDLPAFVITKQVVPVLVGNSAFDCFGELTLRDNKIYVNDADEIVEVEPDKTLDSEDELRLAIQTYLEEGNYQEAANAFDKLRALGEMSMYNTYQYAQVLNILHRNDEGISVSEAWLANNKGRSLLLDFWMYNVLGDCYARKNNRSKAIDSYEDAVDAYCKLFNTSLKDIKKSKFKDETLGNTMYNLARQYAYVNIAMTEYYSALAAKSGNQAAIEFCKECKIRY